MAVKNGISNTEVNKKRNLIAELLFIDYFRYIIVLIINFY